MNCQSHESSGHIQTDSVWVKDRREKKTVEAKSTNNIRQQKVNNIHMVWCLSEVTYSLYMLLKCFVFCIYFSLFSLSPSVCCQLNGSADRPITLLKKKKEVLFCEAIYMPSSPRTQTEYECTFEYMPLLRFFTLLIFFSTFCASRRFSRNIDDAPYFVYFFISCWPY